MTTVERIATLGAELAEVVLAECLMKDCPCQRCRLAREIQAESAKADFPSLEPERENDGLCVECRQPSETRLCGNCNQKAEPNCLVAPITDEMIEAANPGAPVTQDVNADEFVLLFRDYSEPTDAQRLAAAAGLKDANGRPWAERFTENEESPIRMSHDGLPIIPYRREDQPISEKDLRALKTIGEITGRTR